MKPAPKVSVVVEGDGKAAVCMALALADAGVLVHHLIRGPTLAMDTWEHRADLIRVTQHTHIDTRLSTHIHEVDRTAEGWRVIAKQTPQFVDPARCTACGRCEETCPVTIVTSDGVPSPAITRGDAPTTYTIHKAGTAPCRDACPVHQHAQGYIALIRQRRYLEAYQLIRADNPFPALCGRICNHYCEQACTRNQLDDPVAVMALKRFVADWAYAHRDELPSLAPPLPRQPRSGKRVAIVGAGPAGLTAAQDLVRQGHTVTVFDRLPVAGGMLRVGVPPFRLPHHLIDWEVQQILDQGVELRLNTPVDNANDLLAQGYDAVFLAVGAHKARILPIPGNDLPEVSTSLAFLKRVNLGEPVHVQGKRVLVLGGGNVAIDVARTALREGAAVVSMACLESYEQMPASPWELHDAEAEGVIVYPGRTFKEIISEDGHVAGVHCVRVDFRGFANGKPDIDEYPDSDHVLPADMVFFAVGQHPDLDLLPADGIIDRTPWGTIVADEHTGVTAQPGIFAGADCVKGAMFFAIDAIAAGHSVAHAIDCYLRGIPIESPHLPSLSRVTLTHAEIEQRLTLWGIVEQHRVPIPVVPVKDRLRGHIEVETGYTENMALREADRCLRCGACSECMQCAEVCPAGAIHHTAQAHTLTLEAHAVVRTVAQDELDGAIHLAPDDEENALALAEQIIAELAPVSHPPRPYATPEPVSRIGVFLCRCGGVISDVVDHASIAAALTTQFGVAFTQTVDFACHPEGRDSIQDAMEMHNLDRAVLAACSCCALDQVCTSCSNQRVRCKTQLLRDAQLPVDFVNVREHAALIHTEQMATVVAMDLIAGAVARTRSLNTDWPGRTIARIDRDRCRDCGDCVAVCAYEALRVDRSNGRVVVTVDESRCVGCGSCAAVCPTGAMHSGNTPDAAISVMLDAMDVRDKIVVFTCNWGAYTGFELAGMHRLTYGDRVRMVRLMCASRLHAGLVLKAFAKGAASVLVVGCPPESCHYRADAQARFDQAKQLAALLGISTARLHMAHIAVGDVDSFLSAMNASADAPVSQESEGDR